MPVHSDFPSPQPVQFRGSALARALLRWIGWRFEFAGLPALQGVMVVYPHTSNWDFFIAMLLKSAIGMPVQFWSKDVLFRIPLFGSWLRWVGGVPLRRTAAHGVVQQMVELIKQKKNSGEYFWLALTPEGTRRYTAGWRSGFYRVALEADVPLGVAALDYSRKLLVCREFIRLTGDEARDMQRIAAALEGCRGLRSALAAPIRLRADGINK